MAEILRLFVAATNDLEVQRAVVGRAVAELPVQIGIEIRRSPTLLPILDEVFEKVSNVDRVYFLLGNDITAPAGLEWNLAWRLERSLLPLRRSRRPYRRGAFAGAPGHCARGGQPAASLYGQRAGTPSAFARLSAPAGGAGAHGASRLNYRRTDLEHAYPRISAVA